MSNFVIVDGELYHHGIKGMKWGVRRYQNKDGSLTPAGKKRQIMLDAKGQRDKSKVEYKVNPTKSTKASYKKAKKTYREAKSDFKEQKEIDTFKKHGLDYNIDTIFNVHTYGYKGAKRIEDRIANKKMSRLKAETIEGGRQAAAIALGTMGTMTAATIVAAAVGSPKSQVLDSAGNVIKNIYR